MAWICGLYARDVKCIRNFGELTYCRLITCKTIRESRLNPRGIGCRDMNWIHLA
jgi:hypothetical protein